MYCPALSALFVAEQRPARDVGLLVEHAVLVTPPSTPSLLLPAAPPPVTSGAQMTVHCCVRKTNCADV